MGEIRAGLQRSCRWLIHAISVAFRALVVLASCGALSVTEAAAPAVPAASGSTVPAPKLEAPAPGVGQVILKWSKVPGAATYNVYSGANAADVKKTNRPLQQGLTTTETVVPLGTAPVAGGGVQPVFFAVSAVASGEESDLSSLQSGAPQADAVVKDLTPVAGDRQVQLSWTSIGAASYEVDYGPDPSHLSQAPTLGAVVGSSSKVTATVLGLDNAKTYFFAVRARNIGVNTAALSPAIPATPIVGGTTPPAAKPAASAGTTEQAIDLTKSHCMALKFSQDVLKQAEMEKTGLPESKGSEPSVQSVNSHSIREIQRLLKYEQDWLSRNPDAAETAKAIECNVWLANTTLKFQQQSSTASVQPFPKFNANIANNSQVATTHLVSAFLPTWLSGPADFRQPPSTGTNGPLTAKDLDPYTNSHVYNDVGFDISTSVPISSAKLADYAQQELLTRYGGLLNLYTSFSGRNYANEAYSWGNRAANLDRLYFLDLQTDANDPATAKQSLVFLSEGLGVKALKTSLSGTSSLGAQGTSYIGLGIDGPLFLSDGGDTATLDKNASGSPAGMVSLEGYLSGNVVTGSSITSLFGVTHPQHAYVSWGTNLQLYVTNNIAIQVQYAAAFHYGLGPTVGHVAMLTIGYMQTPKGASTAKNAASTPASSTTSAGDLP